MPPHSAAVMCRVTGPDPQRRKASHASFFGASNGQCTLTNSATLFLATSTRTSSGDDNTEAQADLHVYAICSADIITPFLHPASRSSRRAELLPGTRIDVLPESGPWPAHVSVAGAAEDWWACELHTLGDVEGVQDAVDVLSQQGSDWELGWAKPNYPPPLYDARKANSGIAAMGAPIQHDAPSVHTVMSFFGSHVPPPVPVPPAASHLPGELAVPSPVLYPNGRRRSAAQVAVIKLVRRRAEIEAEREAAKRTQNTTEATPVTAATDPPVLLTPTWPADFPPVTPTSFPAFTVHSWQRSCCGPVPRGTPVSVTSSPYGLLSPTIFHNSLTRGIVANWVSVPDRDGTAAVQAMSSRGASASHFGSVRGWQNQSATSLLAAPPSLLLLDARCFSGSEGAPVLLGPGVHSRCPVTSCSSVGSSGGAAHSAWTGDASAAQPLLGMVTLPLRHTARGSAVELTLAIPAPRLQSFIATQGGLHVWGPPPARSAAASLDPTHVADPTVAPIAYQGGGRGEGWRLMQSVRRRSSSSSSNQTATTESSVANNGYGALLSSYTAAAPSHATDTSSLLPLPLSTSPSGVRPCSLRSSAASCSTPSPASTCAPAVSISSLAVEHAERSVLMAKAGSSWASAIVLTEDGYLLTNAHLLRPFLLPSAPPVVSGGARDPSPPPTELLYDTAIRLQPFAPLSVRVEPHHRRAGTEGEQEHAHECHSGDDEQACTHKRMHRGANIGFAGPSQQQQGQWLPARVIYISQGAWDVALLKVDCDSPLCPVSFHPSALSYAASTHAAELPASAAPPSDELPEVGSNVLVIGHALFPPVSSLLPTITAGILSKVVRLRAAPSAAASPALLCSSAAVHSGNSGGLMVHERSGLFLGMVTSNVMHTPHWPHSFPTHVRWGTDSYQADEKRMAELQRAFEEEQRKAEEVRNARLGSVIMPHLNFTIPYTALLPLRQFCLDGAHDLSVLRALDDAPPMLGRLWQLQDLLDTPPKQPQFSDRYRALMKRLEEEEAQKGFSIPDTETEAEAPVAQSKM